MNCFRPRNGDIFLTDAKFVLETIKQFPSPQWGYIFLR